jgi:2,3-dihydroxy-2,3-dihydro-p-cumate dehydrogenase
MSGSRSTSSSASSSATGSGSGSASCAATPTTTCSSSSPRRTRACIAIAQRLEAEGAKLALGDLEPLTWEGALTVQGDLGEPASANELVHATLSEYGRIDVLVNNAGGGVIRPTLEHTEETLRATLDRNLLTALRTTLATLPHMRAAGYGRIVFVGADSVRNGLDRHAVYNAAKGGVHAFARGLAREFARDGITVNTVAPSATATPELAAILARQPEVGEAFVRVIPVGRPAALEEVASAVAYLAAEEAGFITGQVLSVNGGANMG